MATCCDETKEEKPYLPLRVGYLPEFLVARAEQELGETEEVKARAFREIRKRISQEPNFTCPIDELYLLLHLRSRKFDVDRTFQLLQDSWGVKRRFGYLYDKPDRESLMRTIGLKYVFCLPYRDQEGAAILVIKMRNWDPDVSTADEFVTALTYVCYACAWDPATQVCGVRVLFDVGGVYLKQARSLNTTCFLLVASGLKAKAPLRFVGIHIYNESAIWPMLWSILKRFLSHKIRSRFYFHGTKAEELHKFFPKEILPLEYGGDNKDDVGAWYITEVENFLDIFSGWMKYGYSK